MFQTSQKSGQGQQSGQGQHGEVSEAHHAVAAGAAVVVLQGLAGRLSVQHEGRIIAAQQAPPGPGILRNGNGTPSIAAIPTPDPELSSEPSATALELLNTETDQEDGHGDAIDDVDMAEL